MTPRPQKLVVRVGTHPLQADAVQRVQFLVEGSGPCRVGNRVAARVPHTTTEPTRTAGPALSSFPADSPAPLRESTHGPALPPSA